MTDRPGDIVEVEWVDSTGHGAWHSPDQARELLTKIACRSVGYLLHDEPEGIVITQGAGGVGEYLDSMAIPRVAIVSLTRLTPPIYNWDYMRPPVNPSTVEFEAAPQPSKKAKP